MTFNTKPTQIETLRLHTFDIQASDNRKLEADAIRALRPTFVQDLRRGLDITAGIPRESAFFDRPGLWLLRDTRTAVALVGFVFQFKYWLRKHAVENNQSDIEIAACALEGIGFLDLARPPEGVMSDLQIVAIGILLTVRLQLVMFGLQPARVYEDHDCLPRSPMLKVSECWLHLKHC